MSWPSAAFAHDGSIVLTKNATLVASDGHTSQAAEVAWTFTWAWTGGAPERFGLNVYLVDSGTSKGRSNGKCSGTQVYHNPGVDPNGPQPLAVTTPGPGQYCVNAFMVGGSSRTKVTITFQHSP
jgi:hypothetical protein